MKKVAFHTLGCKVNHYETNAMIQQFLENGYEIVDFDKKADIYVINTCTVTNMSDKKSRQNLRKVKKKNPAAIIVAVGCYAQIAKNELEKIDEIDIALGNNEKKDIIKYINEYNNNKVIKVSEIEKCKEYLELGTVVHLETTRAVIKIQDGCNNFCTYCIIPYARGRIRSRNKDMILNEIQKIVDLGIKEVVLTGIHIDSYGKEKGDNYYLIDLIEDINKIEKLERIRIGSLEPTIITEEFCKRLSKVEKICNHFHLSLQSGCNTTLKRMNRKYTIEEFKKCVELLRTTFKEINLTTDIIVGFPGENEKEFEETYKFLEEIKFFKMHIFKYSKRKGTVAEKMENQIDENIKEERSKMLIELSNRNEEEILKKYINKTIDVLFEEKKDEYWIGHTKNYMTVKVKTEEYLKNLLVSVKIVKYENGSLIAKY